MILHFDPYIFVHSSRSEEVIRDHMQQLSFAGVGVIVVSYYPPGMGDDNGDDWQTIFPKLLKGKPFDSPVTVKVPPQGLPCQNPSESVRIRRRIWTDFGGL